MKHHSKMKIKSRQYEILILCGLFWTATITVLRAIRWPNDWAEAHWLIGYNFGFVKRGLVGTLFSPFANKNAELAIKIASTSLFLLFCLVLFAVCTRITKNGQFDISSILVALIFFTSPYMVMSAHLNGYFDNVLIMLSVLACMLAQRNRIVFSSLVISVGLLIHEIILVVGFPSAIFFALLQHIKQEKPSSTAQLFRGFLSRHKLLLVLPPLTFLCLSFGQTFFLNTATVRRQLTSYLSQFVFVEQNRNVLVPTAFTTSLLDYLIDESPHFLDRIAKPIYALHIGLPLSILLCFGWTKLKPIYSKWTTLCILVAITLLPLSLHIIAWDISRIWTYPIIVALLGVWAITEALPATHLEEEDSILLIMSAVIVICFQLFISTPLMDGVHERFSTEDRILLYMPPLILTIFFMANRYKLIKQSASTRGES